MKELEISAKSVEEAIKLALEQLDASREEVEVTILKEGRTGIIGLGAEEARVKVSLRSPTSGIESDIAETAKSILESLLAAMGIDASVVSRAELVDGETAGAAPPIALDISGDELGILIGRRGETLACLQYIVRTILANKTKTWVPMIIDVEGYRQRRDESLKALAYRVAAQVKVKGVSFTLSPMPAGERRIIHVSLAGHPDVIAESSGEGESRRVVILPRTQ